MTSNNRKNWIGSSDAAAILGVSPWKTPLQLYREKIGEHVEEVTPAKQKIFDRGKRWEPVVIEMLIDELKDRGHDVHVIDRNNRFTDLEHEFLAAEIDVELLIDGETVNGEMKTVHPFAAKAWGDQDTDEIPIYYTAQVLHGQMVTRRNKTIVAALIGADDLRVHTVDRDNEMINLIRAKEIEFWEQVKNREEPEPVSPEDVKLIYAQDNGEVIEADLSMTELIEELRVAKDGIESWTGIKSNIENQLKLIMGDAYLLTIHGRKLITWKTNKPSEKIDWKNAFYDLANHTCAHDDLMNSLISEHTTIRQGARPFLLKG